MTMTIPDALPYLSRGNHKPGSMRACIMDAISILSGRAWELDRPSVVMPLLRPLFIRVNDDANDTERQELWMPGIRAMGTATPGDPDLQTIDHRASVLLVAMQAFRMLAADPAGAHSEGVKALTLVTMWADHPSRELRMAAVAAQAPVDAHTCSGCRLAVAAARGIVSYSVASNALGSELLRRRGHAARMDFLNEVLDDLETLQQHKPVAVSDAQWKELERHVPAQPAPVTSVPMKFLAPISGAYSINAGDTMTWTWSLNTAEAVASNVVSQFVPSAPAVAVVE